MRLATHVDRLDGASTTLAYASSLQPPAIHDHAIDAIRDRIRCARAIARDSFMPGRYHDADVANARTDADPSALTIEDHAIAAGTSDANSAGMIRYLAAALVCAAACTANDSPSRITTGDLYLEAIDVGGGCAIALDGDPPSTQPSVIVADLDDGQTVSITATAAAGSTLGVWHHTANDHGSGDPGTLTGSAESTASVTLGDEPGCVWICCAAIGSDCSTIDPCS